MVGELPMSGKSMLWVVLLTLAALSCSSSGSSGGGGGPADDVIDKGGSFAVKFEPDVPNPGNNTVAMAKSAASGDQITIAVNVTGVDDVIGAAFDVIYDSDLVAWIAPASAGTLLESGGDQVVYDVAVQPDRLIVGAAILGGTAVNAVGTQPLVHLTFRARAAGGSDIRFENSSLQDSQPQDITGLNPWAGGQLIAQ